MDSFFASEPEPLPERRGSTWLITANSPPKPPEVTHAVGYDRFLKLASDFGTPARDLFDLWRFAHFVRAHAAAFRTDLNLQHSAVVFLGNALIAGHQDMIWQHDPRGLVVETTEPAVDWVGDEASDNPLHRSAEVERIVEALIEADEHRFYEFHRTVERWQPQHGEKTDSEPCSEEPWCYSRNRP